MDNEALVTQVEALLRRYNVDLHLTPVIFILLRDKLADLVDESAARACEQLLRDLMRPGIKGGQHHTVSFQVPLITREPR